MGTNKNLLSLEKLGGIGTGLGERFQPRQQKLQVNAMTTLLHQAQTSVNNVHIALTAYENATNHREVVFSGLRTLSTRLLGALIASGALPQTVADARTMTRKLSGYQAVTKAPAPSADASTAGAPAKAARSRDYHSVTDYFAKLIETLAAEPAYQPREADLQVPVLRDKLAALNASNSEVVQSAHTLKEARRQRNALVTGQTDSVYEVGQLAKQYLKSVLGYNSVEYAEVKRLSFTRKPM